MDAPGPLSPEPGPQPGARPRRSAAAWMWSMRLPGRAAIRSRRRKVTTGLVLVALATGGGVAIAATTDTATPTPSASADDPKVIKGDALLKRGGAMGMRFGIGHGGVVHGEFTVPDGDGGYRTMLTQNGTVSGVSGNKLTVKSADGWSKDYTLDTSTMIGGQRFWSADSNGDLTSGQEVMVMATVKDGAAHADHVQTRPDKAMLEKFGAEMKQKMGGRLEERGARVFKFRGGPGGEFRMPMPPGMPGMDGEMSVRPMPPGDSKVPATPDVEPGFFTSPADADFDVLAG